MDHSKIIDTFDTYQGLFVGSSISTFLKAGFKILVSPMLDSLRSSSMIVGESSLSIWFGFGSETLGTYINLGPLPTGASFFLILNEEKVVPKTSMVSSNLPILKF